MGFDYNALEPYISEEQLKIHYQIHHQGYVNNSNAIFEKLESSRSAGLDIDMKSILKSLSFNVGGHILHTLFWKNLAPEGKGGKPDSELLGMINESFGSLDNFKVEFTKAASSVEGSGWAALAYCKSTGRLLISQIEKHNVNVYPTFPIIMVIDVWEHAYYIDYKNQRGKFIDAFWKIVDWNEVSKRLAVVR